MALKEFQQLDSCQFCYIVNSKMLQKVKIKTFVFLNSEMS